MEFYSGRRRTHGWFDRNEVRGEMECSVYRIREATWLRSAPERVAARRIVRDRDRSDVGAQVEQASRFAQIESVESLVEPLIDREDEIA